MSDQKTRPQYEPGTAGAGGKVTGGCGSLTTAAITFAEVAEQIRALLAALAHAQDDGRTDDLVALYAADGVVDVPGLGTFTGVNALREAFAGWAPTVPQRHIVTNTLVTEWGGGSARATSDVVFVQRGDSGWAVATVARYHDTFSNADGTWMLARRSMEFVG